MARRSKGRRTLGDLEQIGGAMRATSKLPIQSRPTRTTAPGLQAARLAAGMSVEEVAQACGYGVGTVVAAEEGAVMHWGQISRIASTIPGHDLSAIRDEGA